MFSPDGRKVKVVDTALKEKGSSFEEWKAAQSAKLEKEVQRMEKEFQKIYDEFALPLLGDLLSDKQEANAAVQKPSMSAVSVDDE
jgi:hypothetical protein